MSGRSMHETAGHRVVALDTAEEVGTVKAFVVDRSATRVERLQVAGRKKHALFADWSSLESFGEDVVMVKTADSLTESDDARDVDAAKGAISILGARILDSDGFEHGTVSDAVFDARTGDIIEVHGPDGAIDAGSIRSLGSYALVVR